MNLSNYFWYFKSALTPKFCDDVIAYANSQQEVMARTGRYVNKKFPFSREWDKLNTYLREHINVEYGFQLINKETWGNVYKPKEISIPLLNIDPIDLRNSADYTLLYGVNVKDCSVRIHYDDNRRKGRSWDIPLKNNQFIMFPSMQMYYITNNQKDSLNFILTITHEFI